jgi:hypothetical protein
MENIIKLLNPIVKATIFVQGRSSTISVIIPTIVTLRNLLYAGNELTSIKEDLLNSLEKRIADAKIESNENYFIATMLDPRFKVDYFAKDQHDHHIAKLKVIAEKMAMEIIESNEEVSAIDSIEDGEDDFFSLIQKSSIGPVQKSVKPDIKIKVTSIFKI